MSDDLTPLQWGIVIFAIVSMISLAVAVANWRVTDCVNMGHGRVYCFFVYVLRW